MNIKAFQDTLSNIIYMELFGKSRIELITEAKKYHVPELVAVHNGDQDEIMRDYMTTDALQALSSVESDCAASYYAHGSLSPAKAIDIARRTARSYRKRVGDIQIFETVWDKD